MDCLCNKKYFMAGYDACLLRFYLAAETKPKRSKMFFSLEIYVSVIAVC